MLVAGGVGVGLDTVKLLKDMGTWAYMIPTADLQRKVLEEMNVVAMKGDLLTDVSKLMSALKGACLEEISCQRDAMMYRDRWIGSRRFHDRRSGDAASDPGCVGNGHSTFCLLSNRRRSSSVYRRRIESRFFFGSRIVMN